MARLHSALPTHVRGQCEGRGAEYSRGRRTVASASCDDAPPGRRPRSEDREGVAIQPRRSLEVLGRGYEMSKRSRGYGLTRDQRGIWHCDFSVAGKRFQRSTFTQDRAHAEEWCAALASEAWRQQKLGEAPGIKWSEAVDRWFTLKLADGKKDLANDDDKRRLLAPELDSLWVHDLTEKIVEDALDRIERRRGKPWQNATRNRYRSFISSVLGELGGGYRVPELSLERRQEPTERVRWITREEATRLLGELPLHLRRMARFAVATGIRQANVTGLMWSKVDLGRRIALVHPESAKAGKFIPIPLNDAAMAVLTEARDCEEHGSAAYCFTYRGEVVQQPANSAWVKALKRAGISDFRWHDLRHTWATWHIMAGTPLPVLQKLGGWASIQMVMKYAHVSEDFAASFANNVCEP